MKRLIFWWKCRKIRIDMFFDFRCEGHAHGLFVYIYRRISHNAMEWFTDEFRAESPYPDSGCWQGYPLSKEGYENRKLYLKKFYKRAIETGKYKEFV